MDMDLIFPNGLSVDAAQQLLLPVLIVVLGMTAYAVFVFKFYRFVAARDMFGLDLSKNDQVRDAVAWDLIFLVWYLVRYLVLFPAFGFFWFAVLTLILVFLSENRELSQVLLIAMATVSAIRVSAYYNEDLSRDLAKILPFAVLGVFIIDTSFFNIQSSLDTLREISTHLETIAYYLIFLVALEFALRFTVRGAETPVPWQARHPGQGSTARPLATQTPLPHPGGLAIRQAPSPNVIERSGMPVTGNADTGAEQEASANWSTPGLVADEAGQEGAVGLGLVPHRDRCSLDLVVFQMAHRYADPVVGTETPLPAVGVRDQQGVEVARVVRLGVHPVDVSGDVGELGVQGITVAMPGVRRLARVASQHRSQQQRQNVANQADVLYHYGCPWTPVAHTKGRPRRT